MASTYLKKASSQQQIALILPVTNKRVIRSLHTPDQQKAALIADKVQTLADTLTGPDKQRQSVLRVLVEDVFLAAGVPNPWAPVTEKTTAPIFKTFAADFIARKPSSKDAKDYVKTVCGTFTHKDKPLDQITGQECQAWYDLISANVTVGTARNRLFAVSSVFAQALRLSIIRNNPCIGIQTKPEEDSMREEFTDEETDKIIAWLKEKQWDEWVSMVLLARWAGMRMMDAVNLSRSNVVADGAGGYSLQFVAGKTGSPVVVPCCPVLAEHLSRFMWVKGEFLCPNLRLCSNSMLSNAFADILDAAGIDCGKHLVNGRWRRRKTFHSLRTSFCMGLARAGMPEELRMLVAGHSTKRAHASYMKHTAEDVVKLTEEFINPKTEVAL